MIKPNFEIMAEYNAVMNQKICDSILNTPDSVLWQNKKAFFGSILGTLNHPMVGDLIWLNRFNQHPSYPEGFKALESLKNFPLPSKLTQILYEDKTSFNSHRQVLDRMVIQFIKESCEGDYSEVLSYRNTKSNTFHKPFVMLVQHLFNHQTHHRGQVTTLLAQMDIDIGGTDLLLLIPDVDD